MFYWRITNITLVTILSFLFSCKQKTEVKSLYNIDSVISTQIKFLVDEKATLKKRALISLAEDDSTFIPKDSSAWNRELEMFRSLNSVNKPVNRDQYLVDDNLYDPASNLTVKAFSAKNDLPVKFLRVFYQKSIDKPRKIEAMVEDNTALFKSGRYLTMEFQKVNNKTVLISYSVKGGQKMILGDTVSFFIEGKISID